MNKCLVICPTYNRISKFTEMARSFYQNSVYSDLIVLTAEGSITPLINSVNYEKYDYISVTNDDFIYQTHAWDKILIETIQRKGFGIAFGNDGTNNKHLPSTCIIDARITRALGWIQYPRLEHLCGDMVWQTLGKLLNCLYYVPDVHIEHRHFLFGKADKSDYERTNSREMYKKDNALFQEWLSKESQSDIVKIQEALKV